MHLFRPKPLAALGARLRPQARLPRLASPGPGRRRNGARKSIVRKVAVLLLRSMRSWRPTPREAAEEFAELEAQRRSAGAGLLLQASAVEACRLLAMDCCSRRPRPWRRGRRLCNRLPARESLRLLPALARGMRRWGGLRLIPSTATCIA